MALLLAGSMSIWSSVAAAAVTVGEAPPDDLGKDFQDQPVSVSQFRGKVVIVTFWASWCAPCRAEMDLLDRVQRVAGRDAMAIVAVNFKEDDRTWRQYKKRLKDVALTITRDRTQKVPEDYEVKGIPRMIMIDKQGVVVRIHTGYDEKYLDQLLAEMNELLAAPTTVPGEAAAAGEMAPTEDPQPGL
ncbi:MAG TPA: TlpA disulfide reductase family protein [Fontimonas sp.]